jgi:endoglucanase Acf2
MKRHEITLRREASRSDLQIHLKMTQRSMSAPNVLSIDQPSHVVRIQRNSLPSITSTEEIGYELHSSSFKSTKYTTPVYASQRRPAQTTSISPKSSTTAVPYKMYDSKSPRSPTVAASLKRRPSSGSLFYSNVVAQQISANNWKYPYRHVPPKATTPTCSHACVAGIFAIIVVSSVVILMITELRSANH